MAACFPGRRGNFWVLTRADPSQKWIPDALGLNLYLHCSHKNLEEMSPPHTHPFICKTEKQFLVQRLRTSAGQETPAHTP
ncbi:hypothetical protein LEMLEM_LOCUS21510, partial [Lemmus lemmus]